MLRIGEAAKKFDISNRTLRYWEEEGILSSTRTEKGYRFYDSENTNRIKQIVLLRKLRMPIADIERIFISDDFDVAIDALTSHLENLRQESTVVNSLRTLIEKLISHIKAEKNLTQVFSYLEKQSKTTDSELEKALQIMLSERNNHMSANVLSDVRIVRLPAMTVAAYRAMSETPEKDCSEVMNKFVLNNSLQRKGCFRHFGFNNPSPSENNPVYGYEMWVAIPENFEIPEPLVKKQFDGGLYASIPTKMGEIGENWQKLYNWVKNNDKYEVDFSFQWLEESTDFETFISSDESAQQLDLLEPIKLK
jgi:DNA-binding transcriptional MerR regulator/predicted transcriptional regulator YdeE